MLPQIETITTDPITIDEAAKKLGDIRFIGTVLIDSSLDLTIENALAILAKGRANKPLAWTVTPEELPALWAELAGTGD